MKVRITKVDDTVIDITVSDNQTAKEYEDLPFQRDDIAHVIVTDDN